MKRNGYICWDEYFMGIAELSKLRSKDPVTQVGACIIDGNKRIVSVGYNGFQNNCSDDEFPWDKDKNADLYDTKYPYVVHAELNAILNAKVDLNNGIIYVTLFPCCECAKAIIQSGIHTVIYDSDKNIDTSSAKASIRMFKAAGVEIIHYSNLNVGHLDISLIH